MPVDLTVGPPPRPETEAEPGAPSDTPLFAEPAEPELVPPVDEAVVRGLVKGLGSVAHVIAGDDDVEDHWQFTDAELDGVTPPLTRIINRRPKWRAAVARGDEATVLLILASYGGRNVEAGRKAREERELDGQPGEAGGVADHARAARDGTGPGAAHSGGNGAQLRDAPGGGFR